MFCPNCGRDNLESAAHCAACGVSLSGMAPPPPLPGTGPVYGMPGGHTEPKPENYLVWAILTTLFCCLPAGIASIVFAAQVDSKYAARDYAGARESSEKAKYWAYVSLGAWAALVVGYLVLVGFVLIAQPR